jgi:uncharacterized protein involved in tolerance to divalent cations
MGVGGGLSMAATIVLGASRSLEGCRIFAEELVREGFVANATVIPTPVSIIKGTQKGIETIDEYLVMLETDDKAVSHVVEFLKSNPNYQITEVVAIPISGGSWDYLSHVSEVTSPRKNQK